MDPLHHPTVRIVLIMAFVLPVVAMSPPCVINLMADQTMSRHSTHKSQLVVTGYCAFKLTVCAS